MQKFYLLLLTLFLHSFVYELPAQLIKINQSKDKYEPDTPYLMIQEGHASSIVSINFTTKSDQLLTFASGQYKLWDAFTGKLIWEVNIDPTRDYTLITPDGKFRISVKKGGISTVEEIIEKGINNDLITKTLDKNSNPSEGDNFFQIYQSAYKALLERLTFTATNYDKTYITVNYPDRDKDGNIRDKDGNVIDKKPYKIFKTIEYKLLKKDLFRPIQITKSAFKEYADELVKEILTNKSEYSSEELDYIKKRSDYYRITKPKKDEDDLAIKPRIGLSIKPTVFSNDLKTAIIISELNELSDKETLSIKLWDMENDTLIDVVSSLPAIPNPEEGLATLFVERYRACYSPDNKYIAFVQNNLGYNNADFTINIWGIENRGMVREFTIPNLGNENFTFSSDKKFIISGDLSNYLKVWDFRKGKIIDTFDEYVGMQEDPETKGAYLVRNFYKKQQFALGLKNDIGNVLDTYDAGRSAITNAMSFNLKGVVGAWKKFRDIKDKEDTKSESIESIIDFLNLKPKLDRMFFGTNLFKNPLNMVAIEGNTVNRRRRYAIETPEKKIVIYDLDASLKNKDIPIDVPKLNRAQQDFEKVKQKIYSYGNENELKIKALNIVGKTSEKLGLTENFKKIESQQVDNSPKYDFLKNAGKKLGIFRQNFIDKFKIMELDTDGMRGINREGLFISKLNQFITWGNDRFVTVWDLEKQIPIAKFGSKLIQKKKKIKGVKQKSEKEIKLEKLQKIIDELESQYKQVKSQYKSSKDKELKAKYEDLENQITVIEAEYKVVKKSKKPKSGPSWKENLLNKITNTTRIVHQVAIAKDNKTAAFIYDDEELSIWDLEPKAKEVKAGKEKADLEEDSKEGKKPKLKPLEKPILNLGIQEGITDFIFTKDDKYLITVGEDRNVEFWNVQTGKVEKSYNIKGSKITLLPKGERAMVGNKIWRLSDGTVEKTLKDFQQDLNKIYFDDEETVLLCGRQIWDVDSVKLKCFIHTVRGTSDYIIYNQEGYYKSTRGGAETLHFIYNGKVYQFDQFDLQFNRPDLVLNSIGVMPQEVTDAYYKAYLKRVRRLGLDPDSLDKNLVFNAPEIKRLGDASKFFASKVRKFNFAVEIKDDKYKLDRVNVNVNGVPVFGLLGKSLKDLNTNSVQQGFEIDLNEGKNIIQVYAMNEKGVESLKERFEVDYIPAQGEKTSRTLYLITMGVANYKESEKNLKLPVNDAKGISGQFAKSRFFDNIKVITLLDEKLTIDTLVALRNTLEKTKVDDYVIVAYAGHGMLDAEYNYYLATSNTDFLNPTKENSIYYEDLMGWLDEIPARQKILLLDACHSGEVDKEEVTETEKMDGFSEKSEIKISASSDLGLGNSFELMQELFTDLQKNTGTTVISAAQGKDPAIEDPTKKNSEFTTVLLKAITEFDTHTITENDQEIEKKFLKADADGDGIVMLSELMKYIIKEVPKESEGKQQPTTRVENIVYDFPIW